MASYLAEQPPSRVVDALVDVGGGVVVGGGPGGQGVGARVGQLQPVVLGLLRLLQGVEGHAACGGRGGPGAGVVAPWAALPVLHGLREVGLEEREIYIKFNET